MFRPYIAECIATFAMVFAGTGAIVVNDTTGGRVTHVGVSLVFGFIVFAMIATFGRTSGAHMNPAVTIALTVAGKFKLKLVPGYIASQAVGAFLASMLLMILFPGHAGLGGTKPNGTELQSWILECVLTLFLMLAVLGVGTSSNGNVLAEGLVIGAVIGLEALFAGPICGASMNPIRSLAPAVVSGETKHVWIYLTAPVTGALLALPLAWASIEPKRETL